VVANVEAPTTAVQPCESGFLDALIRDFALLTFLARLEYVKIRNLHPLLSYNGSLLAKRLDGVMDQCHRLQAAPHLIPSSSMRDSFFTKIAHLSSLLEIVTEIASRKVAFERATSYPISSIERPFTNQLLTEIGAPSIVVEPPVLHPNKVGALKPWNTWLNNHVVDRYVAGWIAIEQRIPRIGDRLTRMLSNMYDAIQEIFQEVGLNSLVVVLTLTRNSADPHRIGWLSQS
jgi:hypothetical protein